MAMPNRAGRFHAYPVEIGVDETGTNKLATVMLKLELYEELTPTGPADVTAEGLEITAYLYIQKKDGGINEHAVNALRDSLGWNPADGLGWLAKTDLSAHAVQVTLGFELYEGVQRIKVKYVNPYGSTGGGGVTQADAGKMQDLSNRLDSRLRAYSGGKAVAAPPPATARPSPPPAAKAPASDEASAWTAFAKACPEIYTQEDTESAWFAAIGKLFPGREVATLTPAEWGVVLAKAPGMATPL